MIGESNEISERGIDVALVVAMGPAALTMGTGTGSSVRPVRSAAPSTGRVPMGSGPSTHRCGGKTYSGQYFQITRDTTVTASGLSGRGGWAEAAAAGLLGVDPSPDFITHYSGAWSRSSGTERYAYAIQFQLVHPSDGMNGGGLGSVNCPMERALMPIFRRV